MQSAWILLKLRSHAETQLLDDQRQHVEYLLNPGKRCHFQVYW